MTLFLDKLLAQLAYPLNFSLSLCLLSLACFVRDSRRSGLALITMAATWLWFWSMPVISDGARFWLERSHVQGRVEDLPVADALVVLGGGLDGGPPGWPYPNLGAAADRVWHAARIYHAGKTPWLILSGGYMEWQGERTPEAEAMRGLLRDFGVPDAAMALEGLSHNTRENALNSADLLRARGAGKVLLVTSALHMRRALATFRAAGIMAVPAPVDFEVMPSAGHVLRWMPDAEALVGSTRAIKEVLGLWIYRWRGWAR